VLELTHRGHRVVVETGAGVGAGFSDDDYRAAGAAIVGRVAEVFDAAELIVKVKEPQAEERAMLGPQHTLFTYLHLAPDVPQTRELLASGATCVAYETVVDAQGGLPLLTPMSQVAGRMAIQAGAHCLEKPNGGAGVLLGGVPGVPGAQVCVIGGGVVGSNAIEMAVGLGADVTVLDRNLAVLERIEARFGATVRTVYSTRAALERYVVEADLVVGAVLLPGAAAPKLVTAGMVGAMRSGSVIVDVAIDQGGCAETSRPTTHDEPTYIVDEVVHYCVANMPGAVPRTSAAALNNATLPYVLALVERGVPHALAEVPGFLPGLNVCRGLLTEPHVADAQGLAYTPAADALALLG
jgi:alanine dehydrogenase